MKDITIKGKTIKFEIYFFIACFLFVCGLNVYSILKYNTQWSELYSQLHFVLIVSCVLYIFLFIVRRLTQFIFKLIRRK